jgi:hypothetical protein
VCGDGIGQFSRIKWVANDTSVDIFRNGQLESKSRFSKKVPQYEKTALATKNLPALPATVYMAKKMGKSLAGGQVLFHCLQHRRS